MQVLEKIDMRDKAPSGLGYEYWLLVDGYGANDCLLVDAASDNPKVARCHPVIPAEQMHVDALGCELGDLICGVRWFEPYKGQDVINLPQNQ